MCAGFIPTPNVASVELIYGINGQIVENQIYVQKGSPYSASDLSAVRTIVDTWDSATWKGARGPTVFLNRIRTKARDSEGAPMEDYSLPAPRAGTLPGILLPAGVSMAFKLSTGRTGRSFRGRWYWVGMTTINLGVTSNQIDVASANAVQGFLNTLIANLAAGGHTVGVVSYRHNKVFRTQGLFTPAIGYVIVDYNVDSMRRRLTGRGA